MPESAAFPFPFPSFPDPPLRLDVNERDDCFKAGLRRVDDALDGGILIAVVPLVVVVLE